MTYIRIKKKNNGHLLQKRYWWDGIDIVNSPILQDLNIDYEVDLFIDYFKIKLNKMDFEYHLLNNEKNTYHRPTSHYYWTPNFKKAFANALKNNKTVTQLEIYGDLYDSNTLPYLKKSSNQEWIAALSTSSVTKFQCHHFELSKKDIALLDFL